MKSFYPLLLAFSSFGVSGYPIEFKNSPEVQTGGCSDAQVLILGAGVTGISAAKTLSEKGITNIIILEADSEIGGRVKNTVLKSSGIRVELGANWIQGIDPLQPDMHPLWKTVSKCGGISGNFVGALNDGSMHVFNQNGENITNSSTFKERFSQWKEIGLSKLSLQRQNCSLQDITAREALNTKGWIPSSSMDDMIEWFGFDYDSFATSPEYVSLYRNFPDYTYIDFGDPDRVTDYFVTDQEGFIKVINCLAQDFLTKNDPRLHLESVVTEIDWSSNECVCVTVKERNSGSDVKYCAPNAVITFSLGVLQSNVVKFIPDLPAAKKSAINAGGFRLYLKIFLEFDHIFWKGEEYVVNILHIDKIRGYYGQFEPFNATSPILFATLTGDLAKMVYNQSVEETTSQIMKVLRSIYGEAIPDPIEVIIPDWWVNPFYRGMYSTPPLGFGTSQTKTLAEPVGRLHFAREATSVRYFGYVHGGYFSGIDVANEIIKREIN